MVFSLQLFFSSKYTRWHWHCFFSLHSLHQYSDNTAELQLFRYNNNWPPPQPPTKVTICHRWKIGQYRSFIRFWWIYTQLLFLFVCFYTGGVGGGILESFRPSVCLSVCSSVRVSDRVRSIYPEPLNYFLPNLVWWCVIITRCVMVKKWFSIFNVKVTARACIIKKMTFWKNYIF